jgi:trimeric autotransporter adhesin
MAWLEAMFGVLYDDGDELEILGGLNFIGFTITADAENNRHNISVSGAATTSDDVSNESAVVGDSVTEALTTLAAGVAASALATRALTAGAGLTGGGDLSADRTFAVAAANGTITVNADSIEVGTIGNTNLSDNTIALARLVNAGAAGFIGATGAGAWGALTGTQAAALLAGPISGITTLAMTGALSGATSIGCTSLACAGPITTVTTLNGATVCAPVEGAVVTTTATINVSQGNQRTVSAAGGAYAITLHASTGSPYTGESITLVCSAALGSAVTVTNGGAGGGNIGFSSGTIPSGFKGCVSFYFDGTNWALSVGSIIRFP